MSPEERDQFKREVLAEISDRASESEQAMLDLLTESDARADTFDELHEKMQRRIAEIYQRTLDRDFPGNHHDEIIRLDTRQSTIENTMGRAQEGNKVSEIIKTSVEAGQSLGTMRIRAVLVMLAIIVVAGFMAAFVISAWRGHPVIQIGPRQITTDTFESRGDVGTVTVEDSAQVITPTLPDSITVRPDFFPNED